MAALGDGNTTICSPLHSSETLIMMDACRVIGAQVVQGESEVKVAGIQRTVPFADPTRSETRHVWAGGSALVGRLLAVISAIIPVEVVVDGNDVLRKRSFEPLLSALRSAGAKIRYFDRKNRIPCMSISSELSGGHYRISTSTSSQVATALMIVALEATGPTTIRLVGNLYSRSYIRQAAAMMRHFGVDVSISPDEREISDSDGQRYRSGRVDITGDYTSASYLMGATFASRGIITLSNLDRHNLQGERAIVDVIAALGARVEWLPTPNTLRIDCTDLSSRVDVAFDLSDSPNILPIVAAMAATIPGRVRLTGGHLTQFHKSRRIEAMATELAKADIGVSLLRDAEGAVDGLEFLVPGCVRPSPVMPELGVRRHYGSPP